ncbi:hypothetical protein M758_3G240600 [Ceratodon purpureus]|uniref:Uncharacterized protein n=1 Tax=Ceratodon purpureus TaxID=3225 RepID=A0A8T0IPE1_CERPU|nr:hypothetical protein KC19_3G240100 [Ceratodon purpureus]KAG0624334.1 hypothetical protein M758_3G240600 [Ceratodon purpureus]
MTQSTDMLNVAGFDLNCHRTTSDQKSSLGTHNISEKHTDWFHLVDLPFENVDMYIGKTGNSFGEPSTRKQESCCREGKERITKLHSLSTVQVTSWLNLCLPTRNVEHFDDIS